MADAGLLARLWALALEPAVTLGSAATSWLELVAFVLALAMVLLNIRVHPTAWPLAIASSLLYLLLFWHHRLYGDAVLQIFFVGVAAWGWRQWLHGRRADGTGLRVAQLHVRARWQVAAVTLVAWPVLGLYLDRATDTDVPYWDAFPTAASVVGQWLLARKWIETWAVWVAVNIVSVGLFAYKGLWLTAVLYALFVMLSVVGWRAWQRQLAPAA
jgi:nicotinamide mononucleotide transporter